jgi:hypothetical protein
MQQRTESHRPAEDTIGGVAKHLRSQLRLRRPSANQPEQRLYFSLAAEFLTTSQFISVTASMATARKQGRRIRFGADASAYLPKEPEIFHRASNDEPAIVFDENLTARLLSVYQQLAAALKLTPMRTVDWTENILLSEQDWTELCSIWQPLCGEAHKLVSVLAKLEILRGSDQLPRLLEIEALTKSASEGGTPCVRSDGLVLIPGWLDRRRDRRIPIGVSVLIEHGRRRQRVTLSDVSINGIGLSSCPSITSGTAMSVELPNGRSLKGQVAWSSGGNIGLKFTEPMSESDPLFRSILELRQTLGTEQ